jgi:parallel beta-helix repeat protein
MNAGDAAGSPVVFTSSLSPQSSGDWNGIKFLDGSAGTLQNCVIEYADIGIYIYGNTSPQILNCTIWHNNYGVYVENNDDDIPQPIVNDCALHTNEYYNFYVGTSGAGGTWWNTHLDATRNWWGADDYTSISAKIHDHSESFSTAYVDVDPWQHEITDEDGPIISDIRYNTIPIASNATIDQPGTFTLQAVDAASGVARVEFYIDTELKHIVSTASGSYSFDWNIVAINDGYYNFTVKAYDTLGNVTEELLENLQVALAAPDTPVITSPESGLITKERTITVSGTAAKYSEVILFNNNAQVASGISVDTEGGFSIPLDLIIGDNNIQAQTSNRGGQSTKTAAVAVNLDPRPDITQPYSGVTLVDATITVRGSTEAGAVVEVFVNGVSQGTTVATSSGYFSLTGVQLSEGNNAITAVSTNSYGVTSPISAAEHVPLNSRPAAPDGLAASPGDTTMVLSWNPSAEPDVAGYHVYRDGQRLTYNFITETGFTDSRLSNGRSYAYAVTAVDDFGSESNLAGSVTAAPVAGAEWIIP